MTSIKSAKFQLQSESDQTFKKDQNDTLNEESDEQSLGQSSEDENQRIVEILFPQKKLRRQRQIQDIQCEEDNDIKAFLEEQVPGLYKHNTKDDIYEDSDDEESEEVMHQNDADYLMNYSINTGPAYFTMSRYEKVNYFQHLNAIYMARMRPQKQTRNARQYFNNYENEYKKQHKNNQGRQNGGKEQKNMKKKRAIKFNQIVCEIPFNKDEEPSVIRETPEQEAFITFDDEAYDELVSDLQERQYEDQEEQQYERMGTLYSTMKCKQDMPMTKVYLHEEDDSSSDEAERLYKLDRMQFIKEYQQISDQRIHQQPQQDSSDQNILFNESDSDQNILRYGYEDEDSAQEKHVEYQKFVQLQKQRESETVEKEQEQQKKSWKRNINGQFVEDSDSSSDDSEDDESSQSQSDNTQKENLQVLENTEQQPKQHKENHQQSQFIEGINGRKINPNQILQLFNQQTPQVPQNNNHELPQNETSQPIFTDKSEDPQSLVQPIQHIQKNTSEDNPIQ